MVCQVCGFEAGRDPETGYNADGICPECQAEGWDVDGVGNIIAPETRPVIEDGE